MLPCRLCSCHISVCKIVVLALWALIFSPGFGVEGSKCGLAKLHTWKVCQCPAFRGSRVPQCQCIGVPEVSQLLQIRWKRLVIDEGHVTGATSTNLTEFARLISAERRWIVTGTPTTNLLGLSL